MVRTYETLLLCDPRRDDSELGQTLDRFTGLVTERGGEVRNVDKWGRRKLAGEVADLSEGYYAVFTYELDPARRGDLEAALPFVEGLVRAKTVRRDIRERRATK
jgi:small subunit ribosomal protein S6